MKLSFTASQDGITARQLAAVRDRLVAFNPTAVVHGGCVGGDDAIDALACELNIPRVIFPSNHPTKSALEACLARDGKVTLGCHPMPPLKRNPMIVQAGHRLIACPREDHEVLRSGTWTTVRIARRTKKPVEVILPAGAMLDAEKWP